MGFIAVYKHLDKLCGEVLNDRRGVTAYIEEMERTPRGAFYAKGWDSDYKQLKHYRWVRNQIAHEPDCDEDNMSGPEDDAWLEAFYDRIMEQNDPLSLYRKATMPKPKVKQTRRQPDKTPTHTLDDTSIYTANRNHKSKNNAALWIGCVALFIALCSLVALVLIL